MIRQVPRKLLWMFAILRDQVNHIKSGLTIGRPLSRATIRDDLDALLDSVDTLERGVINAWSLDEDDDGKAWADDDLVIITAYPDDGGEG